MNTTEFNELYPKPWRWVTCGTTLRASNNKRVASLQLANPRVIPQFEYNRHVMAIVSAETFPCVEEYPLPKYP